MDTSDRLARLKKASLGFTLIELMIVIAVIGILAMVTVPKYQGLIDHYRLESSAQTVAVQLRNAKQYAMDRRTEVYVMFNSKNVQIFYLKNNDNITYEYIPLDNPLSFDSGIIFDFGDSGNQGIKNIPISSDDGHPLNNIPLYDKCLVFGRKGFLEVSPVNIVLSTSRTPSQSVGVRLNADDLAVKINW